MKIWCVQINFKAKICEFFKFILSSVLTKCFLTKKTQNFEWQICDDIELRGKIVCFYQTADKYKEQGIKFIILAIFPVVGKHLCKHRGLWHHFWDLDPCYFF